MRNRWVVNASPLILLGKVGEIELLSKLTDDLVIPRSVVLEIQDGLPTDPARKWLNTSGKERIVPDPPSTEILAAWDLGKGETNVLGWALRHAGFEAILDDRAARKCAAVHGIPYRGTLGVILTARKNNLIPAARPICQKLIDSGLLIDPKLLSDALKMVGE